MSKLISLLMGGCLAVGVAISAVGRTDDGTAALGASNMEIIGHSNLNDYGRDGARLALLVYPDGRRVLYLAHDSGPMCFSARRDPAGAPDHHRPGPGRGGLRPLQVSRPRRHHDGRGCQTARPGQDLMWTVKPGVSRTVPTSLHA